MKKLPNIHPGEILLEEFLKPLGITAYRLAKEIGVPATRISEILKAKRGITVDTALRFSRFFGNTPEFWINLQTEFDLREEKQSKEKELALIHPFDVLVERAKLLRSPKESIID